MWHNAVLQHGCFYSNGNQYSFMQASFHIIVRNGLSMNFSIRGSIARWSHARMVRLTALDIQVSLRNPTAMFGGQHDISENALCEGLCQMHKRGTRQDSKCRLGFTENTTEIWFQSILKPQDSLGRFVTNFLDLQKVDHTIRKHHSTHWQLFWMTCCNVIIPNNKISLCILTMAECSGGTRTFWYLGYFLTIWAFPSKQVTGH